VLEGRLGRNVALGAKLPPIPRKEAEYFDPEIVERIASSMREPYDLLVRLLGTLGPRFGEAAALRRRCVNLLARRLTIEESLGEVSGRLIFGPTKTHAMRKIPVTPSLAAALEEHLEEHVRPEHDALVFTSPRGGLPLRYQELPRASLEAGAGGSPTPPGRGPRPAPFGCGGPHPKRGLRHGRPEDPGAIAAPRSPSPCTGTSSTRTSMWWPRIWIRRGRRGGTNAGPLYTTHSPQGYEAPHGVADRTP
jgi:hypothetical protein